MKKKMNGRTRHRRSGLSMAEMVISMAVAVAAVVCIAQLMALVASQNRQHDFDALAVREAGNIMEDLMSRSWDELAPDNPPAVQMSPACADTLPDPELSIEIADDDTLSGVRRIVVQIRWGSVGKKPSHPVRLVAWRAQYQEEAHP